MSGKGTISVNVEGGRVEGGLTTTPQGVVYGPLRDVLSEWEAVIRKYRPGTDLSSDGFFLFVPEGVKMDGAVFLNSDSHADTSTDTVIILENGASATVFCETGGTCRISDSRDIIVLDGASLFLGEFIGSSGYVGTDNYIMLAEGARAEIVTVEFGPAEAAMKYVSDLAGRNSGLKHSALFMVSGDEKASMDVRVNHLAPDCRSDVMVKGVAAHNSQGGFSGMVYVAPDAQHTEAYQQSRNLLLDDTAQILTSPQLEIYADDVKCSHGATVGRQDGDAVYYMRQRGLSEEQARGLQLAGFVNDIIGRIGDGPLHDKMLSLAESKIKGF